VEQPCTRRVRCRCDAANAVAEEVEEGRTVAECLAVRLKEAVDSTDAVAVVEGRIDAAGLRCVSAKACYGRARCPQGSTNPGDILPVPEVLQECVSFNFLTRSER